MRRPRVVPALLVLFVLVFAACDEDGSPPGAAPAAMQFLEHVDYGCVASRDGSLDCLAGADVTGVEAVGDTVVLRIRFEANCCPQFMETVTYEAGLLTIDVLDTLYACRCICPFENAFRFLAEGSGEMRLLFQSRAARGGDICLSGLDTTIAVP